MEAHLWPPPAPAPWTGLTNGAQYAFDVSATTSAGTGTATRSNTVTPTAPATAPAAPLIGTAAAGVTTDAVISTTARWSAPVSDGGSAITSYIVTASRFSGTTSLSTTRRTVAATLVALKFTGLVSGATHKFQVQAVNAVGTSAFSASSNQVIAR